VSAAAAYAKSDKGGGNNGNGAGGAKDSGKGGNETALAKEKITETVRGRAATLVPINPGRAVQAP